MGGRLVEDDDVRRLQQHPGDGDALLLPAAQAVAAVADDGVETGGEGVDEAQDLGAAERLAQLLLGGGGTGEQEVGADGLVEEVRVLGDHADRRAHRVEGGVADVDAVEPDRTAAHVVEAGDEVADRRLARSRGAHEGDHLTGLDGEVDVEEHLGRRGAVEHRDRLQRGERDLLGARVGEVDVVELDAPGAAGDGDRVRRLVDHRRQVEHLEDALEGDERGHHVDVDVGERGERTVETVEVGGERDHGADVEGAVHRQHPAPAVHQRGGEGRDEEQRGHEHPRVHRLGDADVAHPGGLLLEAVALLVLAAEQLHQQGAGDVEPLSHRRAHAGVDLHPLARQRDQTLAQLAVDDQDQGHDHQRQCRDPPAEAQHDPEGHDQREEVGEDGGRCAHRLLGAEHVVRQPGEQ